MSSRKVKFSNSVKFNNSVKLNNKVKFINNKTKKKNNKMSSNKVLPTNELTETEKKYCSCLMKVRGSKFNPYAICTDSVYNKQGYKRNKVVSCEKYYDFSKYTVPMLRFFLKEKKVKGISKLKKNDLIKKLNELAKK